jgi:zinc protease
LSASLRFSAVSILFSSLIATSLVQPGLAQTGAAASQPAPATVPKIAFEKYTLPNGLQVILHVDRKLPIVHVNQ